LCQRHLHDKALTCSLFLHIRQPDHGIQSSFDTGLIIQFPSFNTKALIGQNDVYIDALPIPTKEGLPVSVTPLVSSSTMETVPFCRNIKQFQDDLHQETTHLDNLLYHLHQYYDWVRTKRQLNLEVPAGFRKTTSHQKMFQEFIPPQETGIYSHDAMSFLNIPTPLDEEIPVPDIDSGVHPNISDTVEKPSSITDTTTTSSTTVPIPIIRSVDKPSTSLPTTIMMSEDHLQPSTSLPTTIMMSEDHLQPSTSLPTTITMSEDHLQACVGFHRVDTLKKHCKDLYAPSIKMDTLPPNAILDIRHLATMHKKPRSTTPVPRSESFADLMYMDITFGPEISVGNVHYGLLFTDRFSRMTYLYPLQNLTTDIPKQLKAFFAHLGTVPRHLFSDFDLKLIVGKAQEYLNSLLVHVNAAPSYHQDKNGILLCQRLILCTMTIRRV
jgi:hypothetical protein